MKEIKETADGLVAKVNAAKALAMRSGEMDTIFTSRELIEQFCGPKYEGKYMMFMGVKVWEDGTDVDALEASEEMSIEQKNNSFK